MKELQGLFRPRQIAEIPAAQFPAISWNRAPQELSSSDNIARIQELDSQNGKTLRQELDTSNGMTWMQELGSQNTRTVTEQVPTNVY